jgi:signal recognition particle subunit SEC65
MPDYFYVYPGYLAEGSSRREGRRVPAPLAVRDVSAEEIAEAAKKLGYTVELQAGKQYPRQFYTFAGRVKLSKQGGVKKAEALRALVTEIARARPPHGTAHKGGHH